MSTGEDEDSVTLESVNSVTLTQDSDGSIILHCPPHVSEGDESFEVTMTATDDSDITEEGVAQIQILQSEDPQNREDISPVSQAWFTTKEDKDTLVNKGHKWKQGMWSKEEIDLLMSNIQQYVKGRGMEDPAEIIFEMSKEERKDFYRSVAWGLNRPLFAVYRRVLRMYDNRNHVGKYSPEEINKLKELRQKHGNDWATIGAALGRSASSVKDRCRLMKDTCNTGKWSEEEERRLSDSVYALAGVCPGRAVTGGVSWAAVADLVGTRSEKQCRSKWLNYLNWKQSGGTEWTKDQDLSLVHRIVELDVDDENELKWEELAGGWSSVRSPQWLRSKWWSIKRQVANHKELPFHVLLKGLQELMETQVPLGAGTGPGSPSLQIRVTRLEECCSSPPRPVTALQIPLQITHLDSAGASDTETITLNTAALQTLQILPSFHLHPTGTPGTYFLQTAANQSLPLSLSSNPTVTLTASSSPSSPEHIILHSLSTEGLCSNDSVIIQTVTSDHSSTEPLCQSQLVVEMQGEEPEQNFLIGSSQGGATETLEPMTDSFTAKVLDSPSQEQAVDSGIAKGAVLIVSPTNVSSTLTDLILENQHGSD
ncbi:cyclin-D-binding Myb-like transcription factor 1 isoform X1 [Oncorhynchus kisutch]|uniref:cyclin-D-binding Myb-like transcription factor 1 isoform X1 n=1 Tax=Oncorhynchus kisutch TaxID=8019 RepID=UPI0012DCE20D|nr:cyclin-D-binding Myb-like transcription factor 1 isoform X1 [Oncorhynchus kisutch]XP_031671119.1 cyclin-D-binding Myb-like transcription factor 1 isoform X1 [Oncorhynchus kisutch]